MKFQCVPTGAVTTLDPGTMIRWGGKEYAVLADRALVMIDPGLPEWFWRNNK